MNSTKLQRESKSNKINDLPKSQQQPTTKYNREKIPLTIARNTINTKIYVAKAEDLNKKKSLILSKCQVF